MIYRVIEREPERRPAFCMEMMVMTEARPDRTSAYRMQYLTNRKIILATQTICAICGKPVDKTLKAPDPMSATVDHIIPVAKHGHPSALENLQLAHRACNRAKWDRLPGEMTGPSRPEKIKHSRDWRTS